MILRPETPKTEAIYKASFKENTIYIQSPEKHDDMYKIVKDFDCIWQWSTKSWYRKIGELSSPVTHRLAELCSLLLNAGFIIDIDDNSIISMIQNQSYEFECKKWIVTGRGDFEGWLRVYWKYPKDLYNQALKIQGSKYDSAYKGICVPSEHYQEVLDFANIYECKIHPKARAIIENAKKIKESQISISLELKKDKKDNYSNIPKLFVPDKINIPEKFIDAKLRNDTFDVLSKPYNHQTQAIEKIKQSNISALFMEMGTGKSYTAIELIRLRQHRINNVIWLTTVNLKDTVYEEIKKHTNLTDIYIFDDKTTIKNVPESFVYIVGLESISSSDRQTLVLNHIVNNHSFVIIDESDKIKGHKSRRTQRLTQICQKAKYRMIMTGTPLSQGIVDLYAQMYFLSPEILGYNSFYSFAHNHLEYSEKYPGLVIRSHNVDYITSKIQPYVYQVTKEECLDLPDKIYEQRYFRLTEEQGAAYWQAKQEILMSVEEINSYTIFQLFSALQQIVSGFWKREGKLLEFPHLRLQYLMELLEQLPENEKVIIWCKYQHSVNQIQKHLSNVSIYYGGLSKREKQEQLDLFRNENKYLIATAGSGGRGLTLVESAYAVFYENEFKYSHRLQAEDRIHRIGQTRKPTYIDLISDSGIDRRIMKAISDKENVTDSFKQKLGETKDFDKDQLKEMLMKI